MRVSWEPILYKNIAFLWVKLYVRISKQMYPKKIPHRFYAVGLFGLDFRLYVPFPRRLSSWEGISSYSYKPSSTPLESIMMGPTFWTTLKFRRWFFYDWRMSFDRWPALRQKSWINYLISPDQSQFQWFQNLAFYGNIGRLKMEKYFSDKKSWSI